MKKSKFVGMACLLLWSQPLRTLAIEKPNVVIIYSGREPTLTDAAVVLGYLDPETFLGGARRLDAGLARDAIDRAVAGPLALAVEAAAAAVLTLATETMVRAIEGITVNQGAESEHMIGHVVYGEDYTSRRALVQLAGLSDSVRERDSFGV